MLRIANRPFENIRTGDSACLVHEAGQPLADRLGEIAREIDPAHIDPALAADAGFRGAAAFAALPGLMIDLLIAAELPGPGAEILGSRLDRTGQVAAGDRLTAKLVVRTLGADRRLTLDATVVAADGRLVATGSAEVRAAEIRVDRPFVVTPQATVAAEAAAPENRPVYRRLLAATAELPPIATAVVHPVDANSIEGALDAAAAGLIQPILIGPEAKIRAAAEAAGRSLSGIRIVDQPHSHAAAERAVALVREGEAAAIMKGALHTDEVMAAAVDKVTGLRTGRRMSHVFALDVPAYPKPLFVTDAAINIYPDLAAKRDIVQNAIDLVRALGTDRPKVAILSAVETVYPAIASTLEAAALCKMADRGQITGGLLDGPLAFDNAVSKAAARAKGIVSEVAGDADILVTPDLEAGNMVAKQLIHLAGAEAAGLVLGARVPIMLTSRADGPAARLASAALAQIFVHRGARP
ncbi:bifunctional enoyl-CoA hydratase/phosphate acetyltransferase [Tistrella mobilis]|uniref:Enoyl-CoA hydratase n=1 Tax=Tistrella mobilis TaxID=171437 RepID=A0A162KV11_9PROT|nr:bifunctional enoyl-CoA hydratase/phosphate acetyltransferase [Tistrella mobilis]KYO52183.1 enoyl-CoA hydratase [Tistrella mobilis]